jgi:hypothetical protein
MLHEPTEPTIRIRPLLEQVRRAAHEADQQERARRPARLHPSACGGCPRKALLHAQKTLATPVDDLGRERMRLGSVYEADTAATLRAALGDRLREQVPLQTDIWDGTCDFVIDHGTLTPILVEHKAQGEKWWDYRETLPRRDHLIQLGLYMLLYEQVYAVRPQALLYYASWGPWAEFTVSVTATSIQAVGLVDGYARDREEWVALADLTQSLEEHFLAGTLPPVLPSWEQDGHCTRRGQPWCGYYHTCFPADADVPF